MSSTIFLDPVPKAQQTVYVQIKNTSDKPNFDVARQVKQALVQKGYHVVGDLTKAHYLLQTNILQAGKANPKKALRILHGGYGGAFDGAAIAVLSTAAMGANGRTGLATGLSHALADLF